ncbi:RidA family protein [Geobacter sp. DSM 9736]|uniref:RidA family protein n=1 Tax=Geobacter sp. DSM 9736 TaxID=1277350 RepID=UPI000B50A4A8|nr:RidA family protein [Geobacter sp. DSM 9736]SNB45075.1 endoribonuclease L-PSP [Geobacter sp. DSM 9736]
MKKTIHSDKAPRAIGPYSQAVIGGGMVFCSGQIPLDPETGELRGGGIREQTEQVMENISAVLGVAGVSFRDIVKTTIFMTDLSDFAIVNEVYGSRFDSEPPARSTVQVSALPRGALVEIEVIALAG